MRQFILFLIPATLIGIVVVFVLPFGVGLTEQVKSPAIRAVLDNRFVRVVLVGAITLLGISLIAPLGRMLRV